MFPSASDRLRTAIRRGIGLAVEFATLGEFGPAVEAAAGGERAVPQAPRPRPGPAAFAFPSADPRPALAHLEPRTNAARRRLGAADALPDPPRPACRHWPARVRRERRPGAARPAPQPCLTAEAQAQSGSP